MIVRSLSFASAILVATAGYAAACTNLQEAMAHFEGVKNAYIEKASQMKPEQFPIWTKRIEEVGAAMGKSDFAGACEALDLASVELGFGGAAAGTNESATIAQPAQPAQPTQPSSTGTLSASETTTQPAQPAQPSAQVAEAGDAAWKECPRGRCWGRR